jgi:hypothetical protein
VYFVAALCVDQLGFGHGDLHLSVMNNELLKGPVAGFVSIPKFTRLPIFGRRCVETASFTDFTDRPHSFTIETISITPPSK